MSTLLSILFGLSLVSWSQLHGNSDVPTCPPGEATVAVPSIDPERGETLFKTADVPNTGARCEDIIGPLKKSHARFTKSSQPAKRFDEYYTSYVFPGENQLNAKDLNCCRVPGTSKVRTDKIQLMRVLVVKSLDDQVRELLRQCQSAGGALLKAETVEKRSIARVLSEDQAYRCVQLK